MIEIFLLIVFLILLSYIFCLDKNNKCTCFTTHIIVGLTALVLYKLIMYYNVSKKFKVLENKLHLSPE